MKNTILESWIKYIDLESLEKAKFNPNKNNAKQFCNLVVTADNNHSVTVSFSGHPELISVLEEQFPIPQNSHERDPKPLFLFFPLVEQVEDDKLFYHPLFAIGITHQKQTLYSDGKLTLRPYNESGYTPLVAAFNRFLGLPTEAFYENLSLQLLLNRITACTNQNFQQSLTSLKQYITDNLISGKPCEYEAMFNGRPPAEYAKMLRNDLTLLSKVDYSHSPLAAQYLEHMANPHEGDDLGENDLWQGAFDPQHPLTKGQAKVLRKLERGDELIAVQGGPGTGKTTLFLSIIANRIVRRAVQLASTGKDMNTLMMIVSTSNKAVENATDKFLKDDEFKDLNHLYFIGGKGEKISNSLSRMKRLIEDLKMAQCDKETYEKTKQALLTAADNLYKPFKEYRRIRDEYQQLLAKGQQLFGGDTLDDWESLVRKKVDALFSKVTSLGYVDKSLVIDVLKSWLQEQQTQVQQYHNRLWTLQQRYPKVNIEDFDPEAREVKKMVASLEDIKERLDGIPRWKFEFILKNDSKCSQNGRTDTISFSRRLSMTSRHSPIRMLLNSSRP